MSGSSAIAALLPPALVVALLSAATPAGAATRCETVTRACIDARNGTARVCVTTICKDDKGDIVSVDTIVLKDDGGVSPPPVKPRLPKYGAGTMETVN
jgi:hypothetical protein